MRTMKRIMKWLFVSGQQRTVEIAEIRQRQQSMMNAMLCFMI